MGAPLKREVVRARVATGLCRNSATHGQATDGQLCASCRERDRLYRLRRRTPEVAPAMNVNGDFWDALSDIFYADRHWLNP